MSGVDVLVVGAGPNGLVAATLLARAGRRVLVCERRDVVGGLAASETFHPGYRGAGVLHDTTPFSSAVIEALDLTRHGLVVRAAAPDVLALGAPGEGLLLAGEAASAARQIAARSPRDAQRWPEFLAFLERVRPVLLRWIDRPAPDLVRLEANRALELLGHALPLLLGGRRALLELLRLPPMPVADWLREWFEDDLLLAALALPAVSGTRSGPRAPGTTFNLLRHAAAAGPGIVGGAASIAEALERAARAAGVEIRTAAEVSRIRTGPRGAEGVELSDGATLAARVVVAGCDPRSLLGLLAPGATDRRLRDDLGRYRMRGGIARLLLALDRPPTFACRPGAAVEFARTGGSLDELERAYDALKYRRLADEPVLDVHVVTTGRPDLAPPGHAVVSVLIHGAPHDLESGWNDASRDWLAERSVALLERHAPGLRSSIVSRELLSPADLERRFALTGGHLDHGENGLDQLLVRPVPGCVRHATPIPGLFLCGGGTHPGGGLSGRPGAFAAAAALASGTPG